MCSCLLAEVVGAVLELVQLRFHAVVVAQVEYYKPQFI